MKFVAAKCPNCGAKIKVDIDQKVYTCNYCRYDIILDDGTSINEQPNTLNKEKLLLHQKNIQKLMMIPIIMFITIFSIVTIFMLVGFLTFNEVKNEIIEPSNNTFEKEQFNMFIDDVGVLNNSLVKFLLNDVIENLTTYDKEITIVYNGTSYSEIAEIMNIVVEVESNSFTSYSVLNEKDNEGYINKIIINKN